MNLFTIFGLLWGYKRATIPVILLTLIGAFYIIVVQPPAYNAKAAVLLVNPPNAPTAAQIASDPKLTHVNTFNPYASLGNLVLVADVVIQVVTAKDAQQALIREGASPQYQVSLDTSFDSPPAIDITGVASNAQSAIQSAQLVANAVSKYLHQMQTSQNVDSTYMITSVEYVKPTSAVTSSSGSLRKLIGILAAGFLLLLITVSVAQALEDRKKSRHAQSRPSTPQTDVYSEPPIKPMAEFTQQSSQDPIYEGGNYPARPQQYMQQRPRGLERQPAGGDVYWNQNG